MAARWWDLYPERYQAEFDELESAGIRYVRDEEAFAAGFLRVSVYPVLEGREYHLVATFPELYPFFKFEVEAPDLHLEHHQHPVSKFLCLLPRGTYWWQPGSDSLTRVLAGVLPRLLASATSDDPSVFADVEEHQAEPFTDYYPYAPESFVLIDGSWRIPKGVSGGAMTIGCDVFPSVQEGGTMSLRSVVIDVSDDQKRSLGKTPTTLTKLFPRHFETRWVRLERPPDPTHNPSQIFEHIAAADVRPRLAPIALARGFLWVRAATFPEEHRWRGLSEPHGDGWLFAVRLAVRSRKKHGKRRRLESPGVSFLARATRFGSSDFRSRIPELGPLADKTIAVFGLGCLGAASTLEFARAGIGALRLVDYDYVDPATIVRWPIGLSAAGRAKATVLENFIGQEYPYTSVTSSPGWRIGGLSEGRGGDYDAIDAVVGDASLVYDATAEYGVQHFLSAIAWTRRVPYIGVESTLGAWGGRVIRIVLGTKAGCWECVQSARVRGEIPQPPVDLSNVDFQPEGCADPTFTGANFDTAEAALMGVRAATSFLTSNDEDWNVATLALRGSDGKRIPPTWTMMRVDPEPNCLTCGNKLFG